MEVADLCLSSVLRKEAQEGVLSKYQRPRDECGRMHRRH